MSNSASIYFHNTFIPTLYDAILVVRPSLLLRDSVGLINPVIDYVQYFRILVYHDSTMLCLLNLCPLEHLTITQAVNLAHCHNLGFASFFILKSYSSVLYAEIAQLCYGGILRGISLSTTDGLCAFGVGVTISYQPILVPVGRAFQGRILNVLGSSMDSLIDLHISSQFQSSLWAQSNSLTSSITNKQVANISLIKITKAILIECLVESLYLVMHTSH